LQRSVVSTVSEEKLIVGQVNLKFINRYRDTWPAGIAALEGGILNVKPLVSHTFPLEKALDAMSLCSDVSQGSIKVQVIDDGVEY
jgi:L-iditol 2-dehydrogenase